PHTPPYLYALSLHDALPIYPQMAVQPFSAALYPTIGNDWCAYPVAHDGVIKTAAYPHQKTLYKHIEVAPVPHPCVDQLIHNAHLDRKSTRLNSSHVSISYAV